MRIASFFETLGVIFLGILVGMMLMIFGLFVPKINAQCFGPSCTPLQGCPGGNCPAPEQACPGGVYPIPVSETIDFNAVLRVRTAERNGYSKGSGAVVRWGEAEVFLTARHVIEDNPHRVEVQYNGQWFPISYVYADSVYDYAIYTAPDCVEPLELGIPDTLQKDTAFFASGFGGDDDQKVKFLALYQRMMRPSGEHPADWMQLRGAAISGDSGGPILTPDGTVVGVLWGSSQQDNTTLATHSRRIAATIDDLVQKEVSQTAVYQIRQFSSPIRKECQYLITPYPLNVHEVDVSMYQKCSVTNFNEQGLLCRPRPQTISRNPNQAGGRIPVPANPPSIIRPITPTPTPQLPPQLPPPVPVSVPDVTINVPQDQTVIAGWMSDLAGKIDGQNLRIDTTEKMVEEAIGQARTIVETTNGRLTTLETQALINAENAKQLPSTIVSISGQVADTKIAEQVPAIAKREANNVIVEWLPIMAAIALAVTVIVLLARKKIDKSGNNNGYVDREDFEIIREKRRAAQALDPTVLLAQSTMIGKMQAEIDALKSKQAV